MESAEQLRGQHTLVLQFLCVWGREERETERERNYPTHLCCRTHALGLSPQTATLLVWWRAYPGRCGRSALFGETVRTTVSWELYWQIAIQEYVGWTVPRDYGHSHNLPAWQYCLFLSWHGFLNHLQAEVVLEPSSCWCLALDWTFRAGHWTLPRPQVGHS